MSRMREEALEWPESKNRDPKLPDDYERRCINCGSSSLMYGGSAGNLYNSYYKCTNCGERMTYNTLMEEWEWLNQIWPLSGESLYISGRCAHLLAFPTAVGRHIVKNSTEGD